MLSNFISGNNIVFSAAFATAFLLTLAFGKLMLPSLKNWQRRGQPIRSDGVGRHAEKSGTPTMGGLIFIPAILMSAVLFMDLSSLIAWLPLFALAAFGFIGFVDDWGKIARGNAYAGLSGMGRLAAEGVVAIALAFLIDATMPAYIPRLSLILPAGVILPIGIFYFRWAYFVIVGSANAANITDGLDGMLSKIFMCVMAVMIVALVGITRIGFMPNLIFLPETAALFPVFGAVFGAVLGFLWFNAKPAYVFMGDCGSLALGGLLGTSALLMKSEIIMAVAAAMFVIILMSSFIQMMYYKFSATKKNPPLLMAPLHHHLELKGWAETKIVERFFILSVIFAGIAVAMLKL
jgi:phospho-N-acetylmuramoyl-pentapeptide-transferase